MMEYMESDNNNELKTDPIRRSLNAVPSLMNLRYALEQFDDQVGAGGQLAMQSAHQRQIGAGFVSERLRV